MAQNRPFWDIDESHIIKNGTRVRNVDKNQNRAIEDLKHLNTLMRYAKQYSQKEIDEDPFITEYVRHGLELFVNTDHKIIEMDPREGRFRAINKPKNVRSRNITPHGTDGRLRASHRHILFRLRDSDYNRMYSTEFLTILFIHEICHTMANHVKWRYNDHGEDFKVYQRLVTKWFIELEFLDNVEYI